MKKHLLCCLLLAFSLAFLDKTASMLLSMYLMMRIIRPIHCFVRL